MSILTALASGPWRLRVHLGATPPASVAAYVLTQAGGGPCTIRVSSQFTVDATNNVVELALTEALSPGINYVLTWSGSSTGFFYDVADLGVDQYGDYEDPEVELFGYDLDWLSGSLAANGDCPSITGVECVRHDLLARVELKKTELAHRPTHGVGVESKINAAASPSALSRFQGEIEAEWRDDDRVADVSATPTVDTQGTVTIDGRVKTVAGITIPSLKNG